MLGSSTGAPGDDGGKNKLQVAHKGSNNLRPKWLRGVPGRNANLSLESCLNVPEPEKWIPFPM
jgi:hypothetical protein